jgi:membrane protein required for beta-lactamase induction
MAMLKCPHCDSPIEAERTWAQTAVASLMAAPAIPDMATQVRCKRCGRISAASDMRPGVAENSMTPRAAVWLVAAALVVWAVVQLLQF